MRLVKYFNSDLYTLFLSIYLLKAVLACYIYVLTITHVKGVQI